MKADDPRLEKPQAAIERVNRVNDMMTVLKNHLVVEHSWMSFDSLRQEG
jgi:hypothetical protein